MLAIATVSCDAPENSVDLGQEVCLGHEEGIVLMEEFEPPKTEVSGWGTQTLPDESVVQVPSDRNSSTKHLIKSRT